MTAPNAHRFPEMYPALDIDLSNLGCVMLDTVQPLLPVGLRLRQLGVLPHVSTDPEHWWIKGAVGDHIAHVTLMYGILKQMFVQKLVYGKLYHWTGFVDTVLSGWKPEDLVVKNVGFFPSPYATDYYWCIVAHLELTDNLLEAHSRLSLLPHIDTFPTYAPHITLAYIRSTKDDRNKVVDQFNNEIQGEYIPVKPLVNYGEHDLG